MASFQVHVDKENPVTSKNTNNFRSNKSNIPTKNTGRSVLGVINNNSRFPDKSSKNDGVNKAQCNNYSEGPEGLNVQDKLYIGAKSKAPFSVYDGVPKEKKEDIKAPENKTLRYKKNPLKDVTNDGKILLPSVCINNQKDDECQNINIGDISPIANTVKDLKADLEEEPMLEGSILETYEMSPMNIDKSQILTSPECLDENIRIKNRESFSVLFDMDEYREDIYNYLKIAEKRHRPKPQYMLRQPDVTYSMRTVLVDWLVEVAEEYKLHNETLYLAISYIDRFLSLMSVVRSKLQLLGTAAMFIASKYEEIYPPEVSEFVYITDDTYSKDQVLRMEHLILKVLKFDISIPTQLSFLTHLAIECKLDDKTLHLAMYLCELSLLEGDPYLQYLPSLIASAAIAKARHCLEKKHTWTTELCKASGYTLEELAECIRNFNETHSKVKILSQKTIYEKYKSNKWSNVSEIPDRPLILLFNS